MKYQPKLIGMKNFLLGIIAIILSSVSVAQDKTTVAILPFTYTRESVQYDNVSPIQETVVNAFVKTRRFNIVDRSKVEALKQEKELQKTDDFIDGKVVEQGRNLGAAFLVSGHVITLKAEQIRTDDGKGNITISYKAKLSISLKVIDVTTGMVVSAETIEPKASGLLGFLGVLASPTEQAAITNSIEKISGSVDDFVSRNFPVMFTIAEIQEKDSKGGATKLLLAGGSSFGIKKGDKLKVVELVAMDINGKQIIRKKEIGELKVTKVEDENFSICSVSDGGLEISNKFAAKSKIQVLTKSN